MTNMAIEVEGLTKHYGRTLAVDGISFRVERGEIFGMVGPNGAGKTTTIECVEGLRRADGGRLTVLGLTPGSSDRELRQRIGIQLQESSLPPRLRVDEAMTLFASFYRRAVDLDAVLDRLDLGSKRRSFFGKLSGGQKQRLFIALALINDPELVFLDELTTGLDPHARRAMWELVEGVRRRGKTVFLTTHFMEEAERLCDRVAILDQGRIVALDPPEELVRRHGGGTRIHLRASPRPALDRLSALDGVHSAEESESGVVVGGDGDDLMQRVLGALSSEGVTVTDVRTRHATLEDVFLALTGRALEREEGA